MMDDRPHTFRADDLPLGTPMERSMAEEIAVLRRLVDTQASLIDTLRARGAASRPDDLPETRREVAPKPLTRGR